jgi:hypothetical protein
MHFTTGARHFFLEEGISPLVEGISPLVEGISPLVGGISPRVEVFFSPL